MVWCAAIKCTNHTSPYMKMYRFPKAPERLKIWVKNMRRDWKPGPGAFLCQVHFEDSQFESGRADGWRKLKPNAIPTLFDFPNRPPKIGKTPTDNNRRTCPLRPQSSLPDNEPDSPPDVPRLPVIVLPETGSSDIVWNGWESLPEKPKIVLSQEQADNLVYDNRNIWTHDSMLFALKTRFALGINGYTYARESMNYPLPSLSTLYRQLAGVDINFGIFESIVEILQIKVDSMPDCERDCVLSIGEIQTSGLMDFDKFKKEFVGHTSVDGSDSVGKYVSLIMLRGTKKPWKQIIAAHVTGPSTPGKVSKTFVEEVIKVAQSVGLRVKAVVSDLGTNSKAMWKELGVKVSEHERKTFFKVNNEEIQVIANPPHLLKKLKNAVLSEDFEFQLSQELCQKHNLSCDKISGNFIKRLWELDMSGDSDLRILHHLKVTDLYPNNLQKMNAGSAVRFFSLETAAALKAAVKFQKLPKEALTTAWFITVICEWYALCCSITRKKSVTVGNKDMKIAKLTEIIDLFQQLKVGGGLNTGFILTCTSIIRLIEGLVQKGSHDFLLLSRFTQDAFENVLSQLRRIAGTTPSAFAVRRALKLITISQFLGKNGGNHEDGSDYYLLDVSNQRNIVDMEETDSTTPPVAPAIS